MKKTIIFVIILVIILAVLAWMFWPKPLIKTIEREESPKVKEDQSLSEIKKKGKFVVGTTAVFEPMSFRDEEGNVVGFDIELAREIASFLGVEVEFKIGDFTDLLNQVKDGKIDVLINAVTITEERSKIYSFSDPYFNNGQGIVVRQENEDIKSEQDLAGKKIGVWRNTTCEIEANKYVGDGEVIPYDNHEEIEALKKGEVDAVVIDQINAMKIAEREISLKSVGKMFSEEYYGVVMQKGDDSLIFEVNKVIKNLKRSHKLDEFGRKWISEKE